MVVSAREEGERTGEEEGGEEEDDDDDEDEDEDEEGGGGGVEPASASSLGLGAAAATAAEASSPNSIRAAAGRCSAVLPRVHGYPSHLTVILYPGTVIVNELELRETGRLEDPIRRA